MEFITCNQGTPEWLAARAGLTTASRFADAISILSRASGQREKGDPTAASDRYAADLAIERISGKPFGEPVRAWILDRGHELEAHARRAYEVEHKAFVTEAGVCVDREGMFGYSSDGLIGGIRGDGLIEIKCPIDSSKILEMWQSGDVSEYMEQMQGGMWITGRKFCDFIMYVPDLEAVGKHLYVKRIMRDDAFIDAMVSELVKFQRRVQDNVYLLKAA